MLSERLSAFNRPSEPPIEAVPLAAVDELERAGLLAGVDQLRPDGSGGLLLTVGSASRLARLMRYWPDEADELAEALGRVGFCISARVVVHVERGA